MTDPTRTASRIGEVFDRRRGSGEMAFMPFVAAGDPNLEGTADILRRLAAADVDLIEVGFPYSDPIADGPVIQTSYTRALAAGFTVDRLFATIEGLDTDGLPPLVAMVAYAIVYRSDPAEFFARAAAAGFSGLIIPDLPGDEAAETTELASAAGLDLVQLLAPTTSLDRAKAILAACRGFVYCISVAGTTGVRRELPEALRDQLAGLRDLTDLPLAVGFGVGSPEQVDFLRGRADGVIVGSALVRHLDAIAEGQPAADVFDTLEAHARELAAACHKQA